MDFVIDFETMGKSDSAVILSIGVLALPESKTTAEVLLKDFSIYIKVNREAQIKLGRTVDKETIEWWRSRGDAAKEVLSKDGIVPCEVAYRRVVDFLLRNGYNTRTSNVWSRGMVDQRWWQSFCTSIGKDDVIPFWTWRDTRTALHLLTGSTEGISKIEDYPELVKHNAQCDCVLDALRLQDCMGEQQETDEVMF